MNKIEVKNQVIDKSLYYRENKDYIFTDCLFKSDENEPLNLLFKSDYITFIRCSFGGSVSIGNKGTGFIDDIYMEEIKAADATSKNKLEVRSASTFVTKSTLELDLKIVADEVELYKVKNENTNINLIFYKRCAIEDSLLSKVSLISNKEKTQISILNSSINDSYIDELSGLTNMQKAGIKNSK